jgi:hypothetical protein
MAARRGRKKTTRRRRKSFNVTNAIFSVAYGSILTEGVFKSSLPEFLLGDLGFGIQSGGGISLKELIARPDLFNQAASNATASLPTMVIQSFALGISERIFKKVMAMPLRRINSGLVKPLLGAGIKL